MPAGDDVTTPSPVLVTVSVRWIGVNTALTVLADDTETAHSVPSGMSQPLHELNTWFAAGEADRLAKVPAGRTTLQVAPQSIPMLEVTLPAPSLITVSGKDWAAARSVVSSL